MEDTLIHQSIDIFKLKLLLKKVIMNKMFFMSTKINFHRKTYLLKANKLLTIKKMSVLEAVKFRMEVYKTLQTRMNQ